MNRVFKIFLIITVAFCGAMTTEEVHASEKAELEISGFRFGEHSISQFERLVLEFKNRSSSKMPPSVKLVPHPSGKETTIYLENGNLVGAIPEAAINDSYAKESKYLGPLSINMDNPALGASLRVFHKGQDLKLDAFWLQKPDRLVVDAYPEHSPRSKGRGVQLGGGASRSVASTKKSNKVKRAPLIGNNPVICFPANSRLQAKVTFEPKEPLIFERSVDVEHTYSEIQKIGSVVCYPRDAQVVAAIGFQSSANESGAPTMSSTESPAPGGLSGLGNRSAGGFGGFGGGSPGAALPPLLKAAPNSPPPSLLPQGSNGVGLAPRAPTSLGQFSRGGAPGGFGRLGGFSPNTSLGAPLPPSGSRLPAQNPNQQLANPGFLVPPR